MDQSLRCPHCVSLVPPERLFGRLLGAVTGKATCPRCHRPFGRRMGDHVARLYSRIMEDFEDRLAQQLKALPVCDRAEVLVQFGLKMESAKVASIEMLLRALDRALEPQLSGLTRGYEGRLDIRRVDRGNCSVVDIDAVVEDGKQSRRRLRIARIESSGFFMVDMGQSVEAASNRHVAR